MDTKSILTIGNSFSVDGTAFLPQIADSSQTLRVEIGQCEIGGCSLERHWNHVVIGRQDPTFKPYHRTRGNALDANAYTLEEALQARAWDVVTMQQVSVKSWRPETYQPFFDNLYQLIRELAPSAEILIQETWSYREDAARFFVENGLTQQSMYEKLHAAYGEIASKYGCRVIPSGTAVQNARIAGGGFDFPDPAYCYYAPTYPELPNQERSLNVGWHWNPMTSDGVPTLGHDTIHLNSRGRFLAGCVWFECLGGGDVRDMTFRPETIDADDAAWLREQAHATVSAR